MARLRVIQWGTGKVGKYALRAILDDPRLALVGVYAWSPDKAGTDAGQLCGRPDTGVLATSDLDALLALNADTVVYTPFEADLDQVVRLLESGLDVVSTNLFLNVGGIRGDVKDRLEAACARGKASIYITGVNPGWANSIVSALTAVCRRVDKVSIFESADCSGYASPETWLAMGMSMPEPTPEVIENARNWLILFRDAVERIAASLAFELTDIEFFAEFATAAERTDLGWFCMEKDTIAAFRGGWKGKVGDRTVVHLEIAWFLTRNLTEGWTFDDDHYHIVIDGEPGVDTRIHFVAPEHWEGPDWSILTALPAVNAAVDIKAARPGILALKDVGLTCAPAGLWLGDAR